MTSPPLAVVGLGVLVDLQRLLTAAWSTAVDECLAHYAVRRGHRDRPFGEDDLPLVQGRADVDAAGAVLEARRIVLPVGDALGDDELTLHGLARRKREVAGELVDGRLRLHDDADDWLRTRTPGSVVVVSASQEVQVVADALGLRGRVAHVVGPPPPDVVVLEPLHRSIVREALQRAGAVAEEAEVIASTEPLATAARHEGVGRVVRVDRGVVDDVRVPMAPDVVVHDLVELDAVGASRGAQD